MQLRRFSRMATLFALCALLLSSSAASANDDWVTLFDGKSLKNWDGNPNFWSVRDGAITGQTTKENPTKGNTFIIWRGGEVADFELKLQYRIIGGNSGIQYRSFEVEGQKWVVGGYQADFEAGRTYSGILYGERFRGILANRGQKTVIGTDGKPKVVGSVGDSDEIQSKIRDEDWNDYHVVARGNVFKHFINGVQTIECTDEDDAARASGILALQLHAGPPMTVQFRRIQLRHIPSAKSAALDSKKKREPESLTQGGLSGLAAVSDARGPQKRIAFIAGPRSHGYGAHEHKAGSILLARKLEEAMPHLKPIVFTNGWPREPGALDGFDCIVMYCDGGGRHIVNPHLEEMDAYARAGVGIVCLHYGVEVPIGPSGEKFLEWIGGYFETNWSVNPHWTASFTEFPDHPITNGVEPFSTNDEWYYHMRFRDGMQGVTPILTDLPPASTLVREDGSLARPDNAHNNNPHVRKAVLERREPQHVAWAATRPDGGRGFGFTGGHNHWNWGNPHQLKLVLNAITWCARAEVPSDGVPASEVTLEQLRENQDYQPKPGFDFERIQKQLDEWHGRQSLSLVPAAVPRPRPVAEKSDGPSGALFQSPIISEETNGHSVEMNVPLQGAESVWLVVSDAGDGLSCDWANWGNPRFVGPQGEVSLTDLKWKSAVSGYGSVQVNRNCQGRPARADGQPLEKCIGTHANSVIEYAVPPGMTHFRSTGVLDEGGTRQGCGSTVRFAVYASRPDLVGLASTGGVQESRDAADALSQLDIAEGLQATLFASEASDPAVLSISAIDVDHRGRVWACEVVNYRHRRGERPEGDRILVLEDTDADGVADRHTVFYQGNEVDTAHGICVLGNRVIVSAGDRVMNFWDDDGDTRADRHDVLFQGISGTQHDHGIHAFAFGPDGKLYFNFGNSGKQIRDREGNLIVDLAGNEVVAQRRPYQEGMAFRCNLDGSELETLGWNFRNNWELCVDSFGTIWQSDNDDDGNRSVRINYVMEYGNYGYRDEFTGAGWREDRTNLESEIPHRHWHLNDPGVVPNLLQTGAGAPTGIVVYEGSLLPKVFHGQIIHCDAGPNVVRAYPVQKDGAGYRARIQNILVGTRDKWFRPSDVCVAPDGSLIIADWYDPGVGGHRMGDAEKGRLFRVAPPGVPYRAPEYDFESIDGAIAALQSPNLEARYLAWQYLRSRDRAAEDALLKLFHSSPNPRMRARALWLLSNLENTGGAFEFLRGAIRDSDPNIRITALRAARELVQRAAAAGLLPGVSDPQAMLASMFVKPLVNDPSAQVRRECAIALRFSHSSDKARLWAQLAAQHDGQDRWYLEALGIGAEKDWDACLNAFLDLRRSLPEDRRPDDRAVLDVIWRSRGAQTPQLLADAIRRGLAADEDLPRVMRAFDFQKADSRESVLFDLAFDYSHKNQERANYVNAEAIKRLDRDVVKRDGALAALDRMLERVAGTSQFVEMVAKFQMADRYPELLELAVAHPEEQLGVDAINALLAAKQWKLISDALNAEDAKTAMATVRVLAVSGNGAAVGPLLPILHDADKPAELRRQAAQAIGMSNNGAQRLIDLAEKNRIDAELIPAVAARLHASSSRKIREQAARLFPLPPAKDARPLPPIQELVARKGDAERGRKVFETTGTCAKCHIVNRKGKDVGPDLSEIGSKLSRTAFFESILFPSAGIAHNYEQYAVILNDGNVVNGLISSRTDQAVTVRNAEGISRTIPMSEVDEIVKQKISIMPADLQKLLSEQDLVDVVEYLQTLRKQAG